MFLLDAVKEPWLKSPEPSVEMVTSEVLFNLPKVKGTPTTAAPTLTFCNLSLVSSSALTSMLPLVAVIEEPARLIEVTPLVLRLL